MRILYFGDLVGAPGCALFQKHGKRLKNVYGADAIIVNGENTAPNGRGITPRIMRFLKHNGADLVTSGNHIFQKKDIFEYLNEHDDLLRPANYPASCPGSGVTSIAIGSRMLGVVLVQGRVFMREQLADPFMAVESAISYLRQKASAIIVEVHAETTSEKSAIAHAFDGQVAAVVGTHTHVQTADERLLSQRTAFITDVGMAGAIHSILGMKPEPIIRGMRTQMPARFEVETEPPYVICGSVIDIDAQTGTASNIERFRVVDEERLDI